MIARLTHAPIKKTNIKHFKNRANRIHGGLSPNISHNKQDS